MDQWPLLVVLAVILAGIVFLVRGIKRLAAKADRDFAQNKERMEAMFRSMFPELQPHFHPRRVYEFVRARHARKAPSGPTTWKKPPGFPAAEAAEIALDGFRDRVRLVDAAGATLGEFVFEEHAEGGVIRMGKGKFTATLNDRQPRVRYWHPDREFKWTPDTWKFTSRMADREIGSSDSGTTYSDTSTSSSPSISPGAAAAAAAGGIIAAGGTFDGGGASAAWDQGAGSSSESHSASGGDSSSDFSSVESGSSSSSTSY